MFEIKYVGDQFNIEEITNITNKVTNITMSPISLSPFRENENQPENRPYASAIGTKKGFSMGFQKLT